MTGTAEAGSMAPARVARAPRLLDAFREAYAEVIRNARALSGEDPPTHEAVKQRLINLLARQAAEVGDSLGDHERVEFDEAQYVMVAMADEVFLHIDWPGREPWARRPLETESRFGTHVAGERIFNRLEEIFASRSSVSGDLLNVYLAALSLGFRGRYRFDASGAEVIRFRRDLIREIRRAEPRMVAPAADLCPETLRGVRDKEQRRGLRGLREGLLPLLLVVTFMVAMGHLLWYYKTSPIREKLDQIDEAREHLDSEQRRAKLAEDKGDKGVRGAAPAGDPRKAEPAADKDGGAEPAQGTKEAAPEGGAP